MTKTVSIENLQVVPLTVDRWDQFEQLFGPNGACAGCWCMWWRLTNKEFTAMHKEGHKEAMRTIVHSGIEPGLIAMADGNPAGWVAVSPRADYIRLATSRVLAPVDDQPVWSIPCFFIHRTYRKLGMMRPLIDAAVEYARQHGAAIMEAYPVEAHEKMNNLSIYTGLVSTFQKAGFTEVARRSENHPVMRKVL